jgi:hypothetical protein
MKQRFDILIRLMQGLAISMISILSSSCTISTTYGTYDGSECPGWVRLEDGGVNIYHLDGWKRNDPYISFYSLGRGKIFVRVNYVGEGNVVFFDNKVKLITQGLPDEAIAEAKAELVITVPLNQDFTLVIPPVSIGAKALPELRVRMHWSDRAVVSSQHIFGS